MQRPVCLSVVGCGCYLYLMDIYPAWHVGLVTNKSDCCTVTVMLVWPLILATDTVCKREQSQQLQQEGSMH